MTTYRKVSSRSQAHRFDTFEHACVGAGQFERRNHEDFVRYHIQHDDDAWVVSLDHVGFSPSYLGA